MEREDILKVEFKKIDANYSYGRILYQNMEILKRGKFKDIDTNIISSNCPYFSGTGTLFIRGEDKTADNMPFIIENKYIEWVKENVDRLNKTYGIKKRWRAKRMEGYYYFNTFLEILEDCEIYSSIEKSRYEIGNYFQTKEEAEAKRDKILKVLEEE